VGAPEATVGDGAEVAAVVRAAMGDKAFATAMTRARDEWAGLRTGETATTDAVHALATSVLTV
jgi:hypothetical protein